MTVLSGDYEQGIARINSYSGKRAKTFAAKNNLCVAYTKIGSLKKAASACEEAIEISEKYGRFKNTPIRPYGSRDQAMAYSNRGVLRAITGDYEGAKTDFEAATEVHRRNVFSSANLARLKEQDVNAMSSIQIDR